MVTAPCLLLRLLLLSVAALAFQQQPLSASVLNDGSPGKGYQPSPAPGNTPNEGHFTPVGDFSAVSSSEYTHLSHPLFPNHGVRIKKTDFCDPSVNSYTGYIDNQAHHLFFYFFESRDDPKTDDVIFWTNGGPGCSSATGLFMELGPCRISDETGPKYFPHSWNNKANVMFVEQPVGVGFSYADYGEEVGTSEEAAVDIAAFVAIFFEHFVQFKGRRFHMAGESYGGRYIPLFASAVYDQNAKLVEAGWTPINLVSAIVGNGMTELPSLYLSYYDMQCTPASLPPFVDVATCVSMKRLLPHCSKWLQESCIDTFDTVRCSAFSQICEGELSAPLYALGKNPYDISKQCEGDISDTLCYPVTKHIENYLNSSATRELLHIPSQLSSRRYTSCSDRVGNAFARTQDGLHSTYLYVGALLEHGVKVLIYAGTYDWICNWVANERWTLALDWSGKEDFVREKLRVWYVDLPVSGEGGKNVTEEKRAGRVRSKGGLTFATVEGAGHMVPFDKPREALAMINRWLAGADL